MHRMFIESDAADDPFEPGLLLRPALGEYASRLASLPALLAFAARQYLEPGGSAGFFESFSRLAHALPTGVFDNTGVGDYLTQLLSRSKRTNDFRQLKHKLFLVATDIDTGASVPFGADGWDDVPIARAVQASAALPGLFPPVEIGGRYLCRRRVDEDAPRIGGAAGRGEVADLHQPAGAVRRSTGGRARTAEAKSRSFDGGLPVDHVADVPHLDLLANARRHGALSHGVSRTPTSCFSSRTATTPRCSSPTCSAIPTAVGCASTPIRRRATICDAAVQGAGDSLGRHGVTIDDEALADEIARCWFAATRGFDAT